MNFILKAKIPIGKKFRTQEYKVEYPHINMITDCYNDQSMAIKGLAQNIYQNNLAAIIAYKVDLSSSKIKLAQRKVNGYTSSYLNTSFGEWGYFVNSIKLLWRLFQSLLFK